MIRRIASQPQRSKTKPAGERAQNEGTKAGGRGNRREEGWLLE